MATYEDRQLVASLFLNTEEGSECEAYHVSTVATVIHVDGTNSSEKDFGDDLQKALEFAMSQTGWITSDIVVMTAIDAIEKSKSRDHVEYDDLKEDYHREAYRSHGMTKRQCEDRLQKLNGKVLGHEAALSVLYTIKAKYDG